MDRAVTEPFEVNIVDSDNFAAMNIDDLAVDQILLQEEIILVAVQRPQCGGRPELERAGGGFHHLVGGNYLQALACFEHQTSNAAGISAGGYGDVLELAAHAALGVGDGGAEHGGEAY